MNDVKHLCELMFDVPAPPLRDGAEAFEIARRTVVRRRRAAVVGSALAAAAVMAAVALVVAPGTTDAPVVGRVTAARATTPPPAGPPPAAPRWKAADQHGKVIARLLMQAVPPGYTTRPWGEDGSGKGESTITFDPYKPVDRPDRPDGPYISITTVAISAAGGQGWLAAVINGDHRPVPTRDLCTPAMADRLLEERGARCEVMTIDGTALRVTTRWRRDEGQITTATRFLNGGYLMVKSGQGISPPKRNVDPPPLARPVFTAQQVARLAIDPAMLP